MLNRWIEEDLLDAVGELGVGVIAFSPLAQGVLTDRYLDGVPADSRAAQGKSLNPDSLTEDTLKHVRALNEIAKQRGQSVAQLALAWTLRDDRVTSALIGASSVAQLEDNLAAVRQPEVLPGRARGHRRRRRRSRHQPLEEELRLPDRRPAGCLRRLARASVASGGSCAVLGHGARAVTVVDGGRSRDGHRLEGDPPGGGCHDRFDARNGPDLRTCPDPGAGRAGSPPGRRAP